MSKLTLALFTLLAFLTFQTKAQAQTNIEIGQARSALNGNNRSATRFYYLFENNRFTTPLQEIEFDGDRAAGKSYTFNVNGVHAEGKLQHMNVGAQYIDTFARTPQGWRITSRREARLVTFGYVFGPGPQVGD